MNFPAEEVATVGGVVFAAAFSIPFAASGRFHAHETKSEEHGHPEPFDRATTKGTAAESLGPNNSYQKLIATEPRHVRDGAREDGP
jgi:hypothetical protein